MKTYVKIENVDERFDTMQDAVQYAENNFDDEIESFEMDVYSESGGHIDNQTVERNPYSNQFVYAAWGFGGQYDWCGEFDTLEQLLESAEYIAAKEKGYDLRVEKYTQTVDENIGDVVDTYEEE